MILEPILNLVSICSQKGVNNVILSPGSRCAPITLAFVRHPKIHSRTISDERAAAFIALGMAQQLEKPVALVCTSGSAAYNYAPAIAEAFFQQIPLIVITADRPPEWIDQWDGQTIRQEEIYGKHVKGSFSFPDDFQHKDKVWHANRIANEAINLAQQFPAGPVHINIPLREPFYPNADEQFNFDSKVKQIDAISTEAVITGETKEKLKSKLSKFNKILIVPGQQRPNEKLQKTLDQIASLNKAVVVTDTISNLQSEETVNFHDHFIGNTVFQKDLNPDLIISFGKSIISKNLKLFLRNSEAEHWHVQQDGYSPDTFQSLTHTIQCQPLSFLKFLEENMASNEFYSSSWNLLEEKIKNNLPKVFSQTEFGEYKAIASCLKFIPQHAKLHVANSMAIRYVNLLGIRKQEVICNRGTSGIDGSNSTAVGCTFTTKDPVTLITGDLAFFYDRNAFWHNYSMPNLRIILLNNHAGGIFRLIDGPAKQPELEEFFETKQTLSAQNLCKDFGFEYHYIADEKSLTDVMENFYHKSLNPKIIEIKTESHKNAEILKWVKAKINEGLL
ncbi:2-succinyl-5-enolpyruvyl-6-hydroxy-3-cyclohexene-1-carboxylic-acid synthase [Belliella sp. DSM 107340]|uniref:2-succinyl-5-enolpyruvyl-6-hydroxy-3-cyclohexene-1-carboxylate synthase n=1 Tax=Belliella calami TaxID=2923436 RepID=A0ABS9UIF8_9BACT|nr:2-succinyl-5-enolpyruvyl-6-hydroxy-3-cyclohexene-1-carboxylic-acid synthase [Belliella calami]MCH7396395.1 2-succinyl-5-enolpyruvyl-6-hydroxy-3-cyclohexene-1-carboxylic-acid synthase [Belliella calami]